MQTVIFVFPHVCLVDKKAQFSFRNVLIKYAKKALLIISDMHCSVPYILKTQQVNWVKYK